MKFIQERILQVEKNFGDLCNVISEYSAKIAKLRNKNDELVKIFEAIASSEYIEKSFGDNSAKFAASLAMMGDRLHQRVMSLDSNVVYELASYEKICRNVRDEIRANSNIRDREALKKRQIDKLRARTTNRSQMSQAEFDFLKATTEFAKTNHNLEEQADNFEKRKLHDFKSIVLNFITVELRYHAYAMELLTLGYQQISSISEVEDLEEHQKPFTPFHFQANNTSNMHRAQSLSSVLDPTTTKRQTYADNYIRKQFVGKSSTNLNRRKSLSTHLNEDMNYDSDDDSDDNVEEDEDVEDDDSNRVNVLKFKSPTSSITSDNTIEGIPDFTVKRHKK